MKSYWFIEGKTNSIIYIKEQCIYTGKIKEFDKLQILNNLKKGIIPKKLFSIPYAYIKSIESPINSKTITVHYGDNSKEELKMNDINTKNEILDLLKTELFSFEYKKQKPSFFKHLKPQMIAILIMVGLCIWTTYIAFQIEIGYSYEIVGGGRPSITHIVLGLAQFGIFKVLAGFLLVISIAIYSFVKIL